ncbi:MAG TPA: PAS domain S-box protein [Terriglobia bacterium]|nr:PAS domain S-box protein [Terriglobia bacterium]
MATSELRTKGDEGSTPRLSPLHVLILENEPADAELSLQELKRTRISIEVEVAQNRMEFEQAIDRHAPDIVLADFNLPGWNGMEALELLRAKRLDSPLILVTGALGEEAAVDCIKRGATDYILKHNLARLPFAVERALEDRRLRVERARAQASLRKEEERFRALIENSADGIVLIDREGSIIFTSHANNHILGYTAEERLGKNIFELIHPEDMARIKETLAGPAFRPGERVVTELRYRLKTGGWRWIECIANNLLTDPSVAGIVINYRDISERMEAEQKIRSLNEELEQRVTERTAQLEAANRGLQTEIAERRRAEAILRRSQERFQLLVEGVRDYAIFILDPSGSVGSWNAGAERITGFRAEEVLGRQYSCFFSSEDVSAGRPCQILRIAETEGRFEEEAWRARKDGSRFLANVVVTALLSPEGKLRGFSHITRDVTERSKAQEAIENLRLQTEMILNAVGEGICGLDPSGNCTFFNPTAERMTGWKAEELTGKNVHILMHHTHADGSPCHIDECLIRKALTEGVTSRVDDEMFWRKDGTGFPVEYISTPIRNQQGEIHGAVLSFQDITERRAIERLKGEFVSVVGHELRTPLTSIRGALGLLAAGLLAGNPKKMQQMLDIALRSTDRLVRLVNDILDLERMQSGQVLMARSECDAGQLLSQAVETMRMMAEKTSIRLEISASSIQVRADSDRITQVLTNLLGNAIKFSPPGAVVTLSVTQEGDEVKFGVQDQGRGIPADKLETIFERFRQVDASDSREKGGTGLGLAICRTIIQQHGGRIWVESVIGGGSTFYFTLLAGQTSKPEGNKYNA